ncbi:MAG: PTS glucose transporter subunit IIA [Oscillospiraceae bacterium]|nr:PTS glucose transporter subunit IIA [Oscillospiraceae bacterium]
MGFFDRFFGKTGTNKKDLIYAPVAGQVVSLTEVPDPVFAEGMLGNGVAILPTDGKVYAPADGVVSTMFDTGHAVSITSSNGAEILIHVGLETVELEGKPFTVHVRNDEKIKKGQLLLEVDLQAVEAAGLPTITPVIICNSDEYAVFRSVTGETATNADVVIELVK